MKKENYISLTLPQLSECKHIVHEYCHETVFLVKHNTSPSCELAVFLIYHQTFVMTDVTLYFLHPESHGCNT